MNPRSDFTRISVVIPVYNARVWIEDALKSVFQQTYDKRYLEVIVVDDGSEDDSAWIAESLLVDISVEYRVLKTTHGGPSRARNIGWQHAKGEWIQFLDADDILHPCKIALQASVLGSLPEQVAVVYSDWQRLAYVNGRWHPVGQVVSPIIGDDPVLDLLESRNTISTGSQLFRRSWLERVSGFDERYWLIEDIHLLLRIAMEGGMFYKVNTDFPVFFYRQRSNSLSHRDAREFIRGCIRNAEMVERHWRSCGELKEQRAWGIANVFFQAARYFASVGDWEEFERMVQGLESLVPGFLPPGPSRLRWLSWLLGYRRAERVAALYRCIKGSARRGFRP